MAKKAKLSNRILAWISPFGAPLGGIHSAAAMAGILGLCGITGTALLGFWPLLGFAFLIGALVYLAFDNRKIKEKLGAEGQDDLSTLLRLQRELMDSNNAKSNSSIAELRARLAPIKNRINRVGNNSKWLRNSLKALCAVLIFSLLFGDDIVGMLFLFPSLLINPIFIPVAAFFAFVFGLLSFWALECSGVFELIDESLGYPIKQLKQAESNQLILNRFENLQQPALKSPPCIEGQKGRIGGRNPTWRPRSRSCPGRRKDVGASPCGRPRLLAHSANKRTS